MKKSMPIILALIALPAFGQQTIYKCPKPDGSTVIQQMPCSPQGGGEKTEVKPIKGTGEGLRPGEIQVLVDLAQHNAAIAKARADAAKAAYEEDKRQEALNIERSKAAAQWATANAILMTGGR